MRIGEDLLGLLAVGGGGLVLLLLWQLIWVARAQVERLRGQAINELIIGTEQAARLAVKAVEQTYVLPAKKKFSTLETKRKQHARNLARRRMQACLGARGVKALREAFGHNLGDFLENQVEAAFWEIEREGNSAPPINEEKSPNASR